MANVRIKDITTTASAPNDDDYLAIDGATAGTRKILATDLNGDVLTDGIKQALLQIASKVAYIDMRGESYYENLLNALYPEAPPAQIISISAEYTQTEAIYVFNSLDDLKNDLLVYANYDDGTSLNVVTYSLSGTLEIGTSTITVTYSGFTTTFDVTVSDFMTLTTYFKGANFGLTNGKMYTSVYDIKRACAFLPIQINGGVKYEAANITGWTYDAYPFPILDGVTKITVSCQDLCCAINVHKDLNGTVYAVDNGHWSNVGGETDYDLTTFIANGATHLSIGFKNSANTSLANTTIDSSTVSISFS